ncbi:hypothetical protein GGR01_003578 [Acetobacter oeni]|nr:hypothetical protein [Acetobacter oeni]
MENLEEIHIRAGLPGKGRTENIFPQAEINIMPVF